MSRIVVAVMAVASLGAIGRASEAQTIAQVFKQVNASVVVVRTTEREMNARGPEIVPGVGSGVLISADGKVLTAAHLVHHPAGPGDPHHRPVQLRAHSGAPGPRASGRGGDDHRAP